jgi:hypothetical protein
MGDYKGTPGVGWGGGLAGCSPSQKSKLRETDFVNMMISKVLRDWPFIRNRLLESADEKCIWNIEK